MAANLFPWGTPWINTMYHRPLHLLVMAFTMCLLCHCTLTGFPHTNAVSSACRTTSPSWSGSCRDLDLSLCAGVLPFDPDVVPFHSYTFYWNDHHQHFCLSLVRYKPCSWMACQDKTNVWSDNPISAVSHLSVGQHRNNVVPWSSTSLNGCLAMSLQKCVCVSKCMSLSGGDSRWGLVPGAKCRDVTLLRTFNLGAGWWVSPADAPAAPTRRVMAGCHVSSVCISVAFRKNIVYIFDSHKCSWIFNWIGIFLWRQITSFYLSPFSWAVNLS